MNETWWLVLAVAVGALTATGWLARERWIHRRRERRAERKEMRE